MWKLLVDSKARDLARSVEAGAEPLCLGGRPRSQLLTGDAVREPDVVLDPRAGAGLPANDHRVDGEEP